MSVEGNFGETGTNVIGTVITAVGQDINFGPNSSPYKSLMVYNAGPAPLTNFTVLVANDASRGRYATLDGTSFTTLGSGLLAKTEFCTANRYFKLQAAVASGSVATLNTYWIW